MTVVGAGIGASRSAVEKEFGDAFLDVSDMEKMSSLWDPRNFVPPVRYIKKNIPAMFKPPVYKPKHTA